MVLLVLAFLGCDGFQLELVARVCCCKIDDTVGELTHLLEIESQENFPHNHLSYILKLRICLEMDK